MQFDFSRRNIIVLGSSKGIGFATAKMLAANGANVCIVGRNADALQHAMNEINALPKGESHNHLSVCCDLTSSASVDLLWQHVAKKWDGCVDSLVLNAGGPPIAKNVANVTRDEWLTYFQSLFLSQIDLVSRCLKHMQENKFGRIVSIASSSIIEVLPGLVISSAIRSALATWLKNLAHEVTIEGINVNTIVLGRVDTERIRSLDQNRAEQSSSSVDAVKASSCINIPAGRYGTPEEVANAITFLLSREASYISGSNITVDGGAIKAY